MAINNFNVGVGTTSQLTRYRYVATGGETSVSGSDADGKTLSYTVGLEQVFLNGVNLVRGQDYTATNGTSVGSLSALVASDVVEVFAYVPFNIANALTVSTVDAKGDLLVGTGADAVGRLAVGTDGQMLIANSGQTSGLQWTTGSILQTVYFSTTTQTDTSSSTMADTGLTVTITPKFSTSKILIISTSQIFKSNGSSNNYMRLRLMRDATEIAVPAVALMLTGAAEENYQMFSYMYLDSPATTSATTYKFQFSAPAATSYVRIQASSTPGTIIAMEVSA
jgi:hypothetical protein